MITKKTKTDFQTLQFTLARSAETELMLNIYLLSTLFTQNSISNTLNQLFKTKINQEALILSCTL